MIEILDALLPALEPGDLEPDLVPHVLRDASLLARLPRPEPLALRRFEPTTSSHVWYTQVLWGVLFSRNQGLFDATTIRLVQIVHLEPP